MGVLAYLEVLALMEVLAFLEVLTFPSLAFVAFEVVVQPIMAFIVVDLDSFMVTHRS